MHFKDFTMTVCRRSWLAAVLAACSSMCYAQDAPKPIKAMLVTGGCCHDYAKQKEVLKKGLQQRANVEVTLVHTADTTTRRPLQDVRKPRLAKGYDVVIHDECTSDVKECPMSRTS